MRTLGQITTPDGFHFTDRRPKTRSGKIILRVFSKFAANEFGSLGDT